jgi:hypothetical protein
MEATRSTPGWSEVDTEVHERLPHEFDGGVMDEMLLPSASSSWRFPIRYRLFSGALFFMIAALAKYYSNTIKQNFKEEGYLAMIEKSIVEMTEIRQSAHEIEQHAQRLSIYSKNQLALHLQRQEQITAEQEAIEDEMMRHLQKLLDTVESTREEALDLVLNMADKVEIDDVAHDVLAVADKIDVEDAVKEDITITNKVEEAVHEVLTMADKVEVEEAVHKPVTAVVHDKVDVEARIQEPPAFMTSSWLTFCFTLVLAVASTCGIMYSHVFFSFLVSMLWIMYHKCRLLCAYVYTSWDRMVFWHDEKKNMYWPPTMTLSNWRTVQWFNRNTKEERPPRFFPGRPAIAMRRATPSHHRAHVEDENRTPVLHKHLPFEVR